MLMAPEPVRTVDVSRPNVLARSYAPTAAEADAPPAGRGLFRMSTVVGLLPPNPRRGDPAVGIPNGRGLPPQNNSCPKWNRSAWFALSTECAPADTLLLGVAAMTRL